MRGLEQIPWLYDLLLGQAERGRFGRWRRWLSGAARGRTLDLGAGTGRNLPWLPADAAAVACDPDALNLAAARRRSPSTPLVRCRAEALPFRDGAFATVLSGMVLCSVDDVPAALAEVRRVLAPGGTLRALEHVRARSPLGGRLQDLVTPGWKLVSGGCRPNRDTEAVLAAAGFEVAPADRQASGTWRALVARPHRRPAP
jgi:ubiquinone/menaquinone biosynthesis C-methylase UbiE